MTNETREKTLLIDGNSIINRAFYGIPLLTNSEGYHTNAILGFVNIMLKTITDEQPDYIGIAFDLKSPTFRHKLYDNYKGNRKGMPNELGEQLPVLKKLLKEMEIDIFEKEGFEADDILGTLSKTFEKKNHNVTVLSGDRDLLQLASENITIKIPKTKKGKTEVEIYKDKEVFEKYEVTPLEFIDLKALMGDASDSIPGVPGIGEKTGIKIIKEYKTIENAYAHYEEIKPTRASNNLKEFYEQAQLSKILATICINCDIKCELRKFNISNLGSQKVLSILKNLEFNSLIKKFSSYNSNSEEDIVKTTKLNFENNIIDTEVKFKQFITQVKEPEITVYNIEVVNDVIIGLSISISADDSFWIEFNNELTDLFVFTSLKDIFTNKNIKIIGHDVKKSIKYLKTFNIELESVYFDTMLAAYILNPSIDNYDYYEIAQEYLDLYVSSEDEIMGVKSSKKCLKDLPLDDRAYFCNMKTNIFYKAHYEMKKKITSNEMDYLYYNIELPLLFVLADMEYHGIKVDIDELSSYSKIIEKQISLLENEIYQYADEKFNINSPKQLGVILFEKLGLPNSKKTKSGYSTAADVLEKIKSKHPIVEKTLEFRQLMKLKSTYVDGLLHCVKDNNKIHSTFKQAVTTTGRISSVDPNLQNIPIKYEAGRKIRKAFIPTNDDYIFIDADYSQIELRLLAYLSNDEKMIQAYKDGIDIHTITASQVFNVDVENVSKEQRSNAKTVNFGIIYGMGAFSLSQDLNITRKKADEYIKTYFEKYPTIENFLDNCVEEATKKGYAETIFGRRRTISELQSSNFRLKSFGERIAKNMPIQGAAADIIKLAMVNVYYRFKSMNLKSRILLQVHDELLVETHKEEVEIVTQIIKEEMENVVELSVPLTVEMNKGNNWLEVK